MHNGLVGTSNNGGDGDRAAMREEVSDLHRQREIDRELIDQLRHEAVAYRDKIANLETALATARRIGAAMGILMARLAFTEDEAFDALRTVSLHTNRKLRELADQVVLTGEMPRP